MSTARRDPRLFDPLIPLAERVSLAFETNGPLSRAVKGFRVREGQKEFALEVCRAVNDKSQLVAEAGTGTGKTFAYLTPALLAGQTCVISTAGKSLQDQLFTKDLPALREALGIPLKISLLKGRANYICLYRLELARSGNSLPEQNSYEKLRRIERFAAVSSSGDRAELPDVPEDDRLWPMVTSTRENCLGKERCPNYEHCFVKKARDEAMESQVVVVNHHLYLSSMALKRESDAIDGMLPQAGLTVIDEAHQLPGIASNFFGSSFSTYDVEDVSVEARMIGRTKCRDGADWEIIFDRVTKAIRELRLAAQTIGLKEGDRFAVEEIERFGELSPSFIRLRDTFVVLGDALKANKGRDDELDTLAERHATVLDEMTLWMEVLTQSRDGVPPEEVSLIDTDKTDDDAMTEGNGASATKQDAKVNRHLVRWVEVSQHGIRFNQTPLSFAREFAEMREREGGAWVFTSATLSAGGDFKHFKASLGIGECVERSWESPFQYWEQGCFYLPVMPPPANNTEEHTANMIDKVWPLINAAGGRAFILCTSLAAVVEAAKRLSALLEANGHPYPLLVQGDRPKMRLIESFRSHGNAILVGSMSFWEGVDVKGDALSLVVIDKLPFAPPNDPVNQARSRAIKESGASPFFVLSLPEAIIALKQGAGRLIRSEEDRGMLVICDTRIVQKGYGKLVLDSLPDFYRTRREDKALEFFLQPERFAEGLYRR